MKITVSKSDLVRALAHVVPVADPKSTMPVLANVKLVAEEARSRMDREDPDRLHGCLSVTTSRLSVTALTEVAIKVDREGSICLPARDLFDRVRVMPDGDIMIDVKGTATTIKAKGSARKFTLHGMPAEEFPKTPELVSPDWEHEIKAVDLLELLASVAVAVSADESRPHLNSLLLERHPEWLRAVATDGHRLHVRATGNATMLGASPVLIPLGSLTRIKSLVEGADGNVLLRRMGVSLWVTVDQLSLCCSVIDQQFVPYRQVIPESSIVRAVVNRVELMDAVKAVSVSASSLTNGIHMSFADGKMQLHAESADGGEGADAVTCDVEGKPEKYGLSARYLLDALGSIASEQVEMNLSGELDQVVVTPVGTKNEQIVVLMPMRI